MKNALPLIRSIGSWIALVILAIVPFAAACDFGGVLRWTQYVIALAVGVALIAVLPAATDRRLLRRAPVAIFLIPVFGWFAYSIFQTIPLPSLLVSFLSAGSYEAYLDWAAPLLSDQSFADTIPISILADSTLASVSLLSIAIAAVWIATQACTTRPRVIFVLCCVSISGALIAVLGVLQFAWPNLDLLGNADLLKRNSFASFINRNNAALFMNLGLAASLGCLSWRLTALTGEEIDGEHFEFSDLVALISDRDSAIGVFSAIACLLGLLACGSRGGLVAAMFGVMFSLGWVRRRRGAGDFLLVGLVVLASVGILAVPLSLELESLRRFELFSDNATTIWQDGRLAHWPDALRTSWAHFPFGSGLGTYSHAALVNQTAENAGWFQHADNLWLEWFAEQGVVAMVILAMMIAVFVNSLRTLSLSHDALDHGLRTAGWFMLGSTLFSQFFDFGLILPANLLLIALLAGVIVARSVEVSVAEAHQDVSPSLLNRWSRHQNDSVIVAGSVVIAVATTLALGWGTNRTYDAARADFAVRNAERVLANERDNFSALTDAKRLLEQASSGADRAEVELSLAQITFQLARFAEIDSMNLRTIDEVSTLYGATSPRTRRLTLIGRNSNDIPSAASESLRRFGNADLYSEALARVSKAIESAPLSRAARVELLYLDFIKFDPRLTNELFDQLQQLYRQSPTTLAYLARLSAESGDGERAEANWLRSLQLLPRRTLPYLRRASEFGNVRVERIVPDTHESALLACRELMRSRSFSREKADALLEEFVDKLDCESLESKEAKSSCLNLAANVLWRLGHARESIEKSRASLELDPSNADLRLTTARRLRAMDDIEGAREMCQTGKEIFEDDQRFKALLDEMAQQEIEAVEGKNSQIESSDATDPEPDVQTESSGTSSSGEISSGQLGR